MESLTSITNDTTFIDTLKNMLPKKQCEHCGKTYSVKHVEVCGNIIEIPVPDCDCEERIKREEEKKERALKLAMDSNIPRKYLYDDLKAWFDTPQKKQMFDFVKKYRDTFDTHYKHGAMYDKGFIISGKPGIGKTRLACHAVRGLIRDYCFQSHYVSSYMLSKDLVAFTDKDKALDDYVKMLSNVSILIFDDIGENDIAAWRTAHFKEIINTRIDKKKLTYFTTMKTPKELVDMFGEHIISRLLLLVGDNILEIEGGVDMRIQSNVEKYEVNK